MLPFFGKTVYDDPGRLRQELRPHLHPQGQDPHPGHRRRPRRRVPRAPELRVLARAARRGRQDPAHHLPQRGPRLRRSGPHPRPHRAHAPVVHHPDARPITTPHPTNHKRGNRHPVGCPVLSPVLENTRVHLSIRHPARHRSTVRTWPRVERVSRSAPPHGLDQQDPCSLIRKPPPHKFFSPSPTPPARTHPTPRPTPLPRQSSPFPPTPPSLLPSLSPHSNILARSAFKPPKGGVLSTTSTSNNCLAAPSRPLKLHLLPVFSAFTLGARLFSVCGRTVQLGFRLDGEVQCVGSSRF